MLKRFVIGLGLFVFALIAVPALLIWWFSPQVVLPPEHATDLAQVERYFQALVEPGYPPGFAVVVRKDGREGFNEAYG